MVKELAAEFEKVFGAGERPRVFFAPGRVNLIGEHTDYNGGHVFPCALSLGTYGAVRKRKDSHIRLYSLNFPDTGIVWRVFFSPFSCMTDIATIWASVDLRDETCEALKYCTKVKHLDIGHSAMTDLSFLDYMPDLEVLIIACSDFEDISHVASCKNLKYLEVCECFRLTDLSPISELKNLGHLNVGDLTVSDISCLHSLVECKNLKRFYAPNMRNMQLDMEKEEAIFRSLLPGVEMDFSKTYMGLGSLNGRWRYTDGFNGGTFTEPYRRIREISRYDEGITAQPRLLF